MRTIPLILSVIVALALLVASGLLAGNMTRRWGAPREFEAARSMLRSFPRHIGRWRMAAAHTFPRKTLGILQCGDAYLDRDYVHEKTGDVVRFTLIAGPYGPMSVHAPTVCYPNLGMMAVGRPKQVALTGGGVTGRFWSATFGGGNVTDPRHQVYYSWSRGGTWAAAKFPRFAFGGAPVLFKLQLDVATAADETNESPGKAFLRDFLPAWYDQVSRTNDFRARTEGPFAAAN